MAISELLGGKKYIIVKIPSGKPPNIIKIDLFPYFDLELSDKYPTTGSVTASIILAIINAITSDFEVKSGVKLLSFDCGK